MSGLVTHIKIRNLHLGSPAPDVHHFSPLITYSSPSRTAEDAIFVASDEATPGSVIPNAERISPFNNGLRYISLCSSEPYLSRTSILPVSGAEQLNTSDEMPYAPITSAK